MSTRTRTPRLLRWLWLLLVCGLLVTTGISGIRDGTANLAVADGPLQHLFVAVQFTYAALGFAALSVFVARPSASPHALAAWGLAATLAAGLGPPLWAKTGVGTGVAAGVTAAAFVAMLVWGQVRYLRSAAAETRETPPAS